jgi:uncharacterized protein
MLAIVSATFMRTAANAFMTFARYAHIKSMSGRAWSVAALMSWDVALFEYLLQAPANRIGYSELPLPQLKILQEIISLSVFVPFAVSYMRKPLRLDYLWAGLCMLAACLLLLRRAERSISVPRETQCHSVRAGAGCDRLARMRCSSRTSSTVRPVLAAMISTSR